jgi:hypothetical protein
MMIMLHVAIALTSLVVSLMGIAITSRHLVRSSYTLIAATVATGSMLLIIEPTHILRVCVTGLAYVALATSLTYIAHRRVQSLVKQTNK